MYVSHSITLGSTHVKMNPYRTAERNSNLTAAQWMYSIKSRLNVSFSFFILLFHSRQQLVPPLQTESTHRLCPSNSCTCEVSLLCQKSWSVGWLVEMQRDIHLSLPLFMYRLQVFKCGTDFSIKVQRPKIVKSVSKCNLLQFFILFSLNHCFMSHFLKRDDSCKLFYSCSAFSHHPSESFSSLSQGLYGLLLQLTPAHLAARSLCFVKINM